MKKIFLVFFILLLFLVALSSCSVAESDVIYQSEMVTVTAKPKPEEFNTVYSCFIELTEESVYRNESVILTGVVTKVTPVSVTLNNDSSTVYENTLFEFAVDRILWDKNNHYVSCPKSITVSVSYNLSFYDAGLLILEEEMPLLLYGYPTEQSQNDPMQKYGYSDFVVSSYHRLMVEKIGDYYVAGDFFADYFPEQKNILEELALDEDSIENLYILLEEEFSFNNPTVIQVCSSARNPQLMFDVLVKFRQRSVGSVVEFWSMLNSFRLISAAEFESKIEQVSKLKK